MVQGHTTRRLITRLIAAQVCLHAGMAGMRMAAPLLALKQGYPAGAVGVLLALFALTQVFMALPAGRYTDRVGFKRPLAWAVVVAVLGTSVALVFAQYWALCVAALCTGGATGCASIALQRHAGRVAHDATELKVVFSWLAIGPAFSNFLGPFVAGLLIDHAGVWLGGTKGDVGGFRSAFLLMAALPLLSWWWVRHTRELPSPVADEGKRRVWDLLREPMLRRLLVVNWFLSSCWDVHTFVVPVISHERGYDASTIGTLLGVFAVSAAGVRMALPLVASHLREHAVISGAMLTTAALFALYPFMPNPLSMGACSVLLGLVLGSVQPMIMSTLHQITPAHRHGEALALRLMSLNGSSVVMPLLFGTLGTTLGVSAVFWMVGAVVGSGARLAWQLKPAASSETQQG